MQDIDAAVHAARQLHRRVSSHAAERGRLLMKLSCRVAAHADDSCVGAARLRQPTKQAKADAAALRGTSEFWRRRLRQALRHTHPLPMATVLTRREPQWAVGTSFPEPPDANFGRSVGGARWWAMRGCRRKTLV